MRACSRAQLEARSFFSSAIGSSNFYSQSRSQVDQHSTTDWWVDKLAYIEAFWVLALISLCLVPLVLLLKKAEPGQAAAAH